MDGRRDYHTERCRLEKDKYHIISSMLNLKYNKKQKRTHRHRKQTYGYKRGELCGRRQKLVWDCRCKQLCMKYRDLLYSTGTIVNKRSEVAQLCLTLCDHVNCSLPGSSIHGIFQTRILDWVNISFSGDSS